MMWEFSPECVSEVVKILREGEVKVMITSSLYATHDHSSEESSEDDSECSMGDSSGSGSGSDSECGSECESDEDQDEVIVDVTTLLHYYEGPDDDTFRYLSLPPHTHTDTLSEMVSKDEVLLTEPHFGTQYFFFLLDSTLFTHLTTDRISEGVRLRLPEPNPYIPYSLNMLPSDTTECSSDTKRLPVLVPHCSSSSSVWHLLDTQFGLPKVWYHVKLTAPPPPHSTSGDTHSLTHSLSYLSSMTRVECAVLCDLFSCVVEDALTEKCYEATLAHLKVSESTCTWCTCE
jgi:hypothetical protein